MCPPLASTKGGGRRHSVSVPEHTHVEAPFHRVQEAVRLSEGHATCGTGVGAAGVCPPATRNGWVAAGPPPGVVGLAEGVTGSMATSPAARAVASPASDCMKAPTVEK